VPRSTPPPLLKHPLMAKNSESGITLANRTFTLTTSQKNLPSSRTNSTKNNSRSSLANWYSTPFSALSVKENSKLSHRKWSSLRANYPILFSSSREISAAAFFWFGVGQSMLRLMASSWGPSAKAKVLDNLQFYSNVRELLLFTVENQSANFL